MLKLQSSNLSSRLTFFVALGGIVVGLLVGFLTGVNPLLVGAALFSVAVLVWFFAKFEQAVIALLVLRTSLDPFSMMQIPAAFAVGVDALTIVYVTVFLLIGRTVRTDGFWWFFAGWVILQGLWVILLPLGGLGLDASFLLDSIREWVRLFSWLMLYLLVMQLQDRIPPQKLISSLLLALVIPITVAFMQMFLPSLLPPMLSLSAGENLGTLSEAGYRIKGTIGHPNGFVTLLLLFMGLTYWKLGLSKQRLPWLLLLGLLAFFYVSTKALFGLMMLTVAVLVLVAPRLNLIKIIGGVFFIALVIGLFAASDFGRERLASLMNTPLLNPDIDISRAILLSKGDNNSFNWRLSQWHLLLNRFWEYPFLGYGLGLSIPVAGNGLLPHNDYIRALIEGGMIGFGTFITFLGVQGARLWQLIRSAPNGSDQRRFCFIMLAIFISIPVGMITENIWSHTTLFFYWMTLMAIAGWNWQEQPPIKNNLGEEIN